MDVNKHVRLLNSTLIKVMEHSLDLFLPRKQEHIQFTKK